MQINTGYINSIKVTSSWRCTFGVPLMEFMYPVFICKPDGATVGDSSPCCCVPCMLAQLILCLLILLSDVHLSVIYEVHRRLNVTYPSLRILFWLADLSLAFRKYRHAFARTHWRIQCGCFCFKYKVKAGWLLSFNTRARGHVQRNIFARLSFIESAFSTELLMGGKMKAAVLHILLRAVSRRIIAGLGWLSIAVLWLSCFTLSR